jgi:hypothetical protein
MVFITWSGVGLLLGGLGRKGDMTMHSPWYGDKNVRLITKTTAGGSTSCASTTIGTDYRY